MVGQDKDLVTLWRTEAADESPAGPLYSGRYAEAELVNEQRSATNCGTDCTNSYPRTCC